MTTEYFHLKGVIYRCLEECKVGCALHYRTVARKGNPRNNSFIHPFSPIATIIYKQRGKASREH